MNKKIVLYILLGIISLVILTAIFIIGSTKKGAEDMKNKTDHVFRIAADINIGDIQLQRPLALREDADELFGNKKYGESRRKHEEAIKACLETIQARATNLIAEAKSYAFDLKEIEDLYNTAQKELELKKYDIASDLYKASIDKALQLLQKYKEEAEKQKPKVESSLRQEAIGRVLNKDYKVSNIVLFANGEWAVATVSPLTFETDEAYVILQLINSDWKIIAGPGTYFEKTELQNAPQEILDYLNG